MYQKINIYDGFNRRVKQTDANGTSYTLYSQKGQLIYRENDVGGTNYIYLGAKLIAKDGAKGAAVMVALTNSKGLNNIDICLQRNMDGLIYATLARPLSMHQQLVVW